MGWTMTGTLTLTMLGVIGMITSVTQGVLASTSSVEGLLTDYRQNPLGVDNLHPEFSWRMISAGRGVRQTAYRIEVATSKPLLVSGKPDMWNSGKVVSSRSVALPYAGKPLKSQTRYFWHVRIWDQDGKPGDFSEPASFETAILNPDEWQGQWITPNEAGAGNGYHSQMTEKAETAKWVQIDLGNPKGFSTVVLYPARPYNWKRDAPGFGFPVRYRVEASDTPDFANPRIIADRTTEDQPNPGTNAVRVDVGKQTARYVRLVATKLDHPQDRDPLLALAEMEILDAAGRNVAFGSSVAALDSIEDAGWSTKKLTDGGRVSREGEATAPILRREFTLDRPIASARAYVTGLGYYELRLNGRKVGDRVLDPPRTAFAKRVCYSVYDVTDLLSQGPNCAGAMLGRGWWNRTPCFLLQLDVVFTDGSTTDIVTDGNWKWAPGPILENSLYNGETCDARKEQPGWDTAGFDDSSWRPVDLQDKTTARLSSEMIQPIKVVNTLTPHSVTSPKPGVYVFDFGQNFSGWCRLSVSGRAGATVTLRHAEVLYPDGTVNQENLRSAKATDTYILRGNGVEVYEPRFTYHGFRYVQVEGYPGEPNLGTIQGREVHTALEPIGDFACSNDLINQIQHASQWGEKTNFHSIPTDCPQRDERQGWMGDAQISAYAMLYNFDMPPAYAKFLRDIADSQGPDGAVPDTVPHVWGGGAGDPVWSAAYPLILWYTYRHTGDTGLLAEHYEGIKRYVEMLRREAKDYIITRNSYGDWVAVVGTPKELISTGSFYQVTRVLADTAEALGKEDDAATYRGLCTKIAEAFNAKFFNPETKQYGNASQFSNAFPLYLGIVPHQYHIAVFGNLVRDILENHKGHLSTGFVGTPYLMDVLVREGRPDVAYTIATQEDYPGWGYMIKNGATTIWELWKLETGRGMNSHNHPAFGAVSGWFYAALAGLEPDPVKPGWEHFTVKPNVVGDLKWVQGSIRTVRGLVKSRWQVTDTGVVLEVTVPANSRATVFVPKDGCLQYAVKEGSSTVWQDGGFVPGTDGVTDGKDAGKWISFEVGSGVYSFELEGQRPIPLTTGSLYIPAGYKPEGNTVDLVMHFQGSPDRVRESLIRSGRRAAIVTVYYPGLSAAYAKPFIEDPKLFGKMLDEAKGHLAKRFGLSEVKIGKLVISSFSAGFGSLREILKSPEYEAQITDMLLVDTIYAGYTHKDGKNLVNPDDVAPFEGIIRKAAEGQVNIWLTYSGVVPPGYASTGEVADYLLDKLGAKLEPAAGELVPGLKLVSKADIGSFHVRGCAGDDGPAHMKHLYALDVLYTKTSLTQNP